MATNTLNRRETPVTIEVDPGREDRPLSVVNGFVFRNPDTARVLVVLAPDNPEESLRRALDHPSMISGSADVILVLPTAEYEARRRARFAAGVSAPYTIDHLTEEAQRIAEQVGCEYLGMVGVDFDAIGGVGRTQDLVIGAVRDRGYTKIYVANPRRTLWQRLLGTGDTATSFGRVLASGVEVVAVTADDRPSNKSLDNE